MSKERFLLWMLTGIFGVQIALFSAASLKCIELKQTDAAACPEVGRRYDQTFGVMIATVLALLGNPRSVK